MTDRLSKEQIGKIDSILQGAADSGRGHLFEHEVYAILQVLGLQDAKRFVTSFDRPNIRYTVLEKHQPHSQLLRFLDKQGEESGIVYALSRKRVEEIAEHLIDRGFSAAAYHAGLQAAERKLDEQSIQTLSIRELAREAGVSPGAPYHHFGDRNGLLVALASYGFEKLVAAIHAAPVGDLGRDFRFEAETFFL